MKNTAIILYITGTTYANSGFPQTTDGGLSFVAIPIRPGVLPSNTTAGLNPQEMGEVAAYLDEERTHADFPPEFHITLDAVETPQGIKICGVHQGHCKTPPPERETAPGLPLVIELLEVIDGMRNRLAHNNANMLVRAALQAAAEAAFGKPIAVPDPDATPSEEDESCYCPHCDSCGECGCCRPDMCKAVMLMGPYCRGNLADYKDMMAQFEALAQLLVETATANPGLLGLQLAKSQAIALAPWLGKPYDFENPEVLPEMAEILKDCQATPTMEGEAECLTKIAGMLYNLLPEALKDPARRNAQNILAGALPSEED